MRRRRRKRLIHNTAATTAATDSSACTIGCVSASTAPAMKSKTEPTQPKIGCRNQPATANTPSTAMKLPTG